MTFKFNFTYDFEQYLIHERKFSPTTLNQYTYTVEMFFNHLKHKYKKSFIDPIEVQPKDIRGFLEERITAGTSISTVNRYVSNIKTFFDYLWSKGKIVIDPAVKIERFKVDRRGVKHVEYSNVIKMFPTIVNSHKYPVILKAIYVLAMHGFRAKEFHILKSEVFEEDQDIFIRTPKRSIVLKGEEASIFRTHFYNSLFDSSEYVFTTKKNSTGGFAPIEYESLYMYIGYIRSDFNLAVTFNLENIRISYAYYLYRKKNYTVDDLAEELGIQRLSAAGLLETTLERYETE